MFYLIPFGLFSSIANAIASAFKWIFDKVLTPVLKLVIMNVVQPVVELVIKALYDILQPVFLMLLQILLTLLDVIEQAFNIFSGTAPIMIKQSTETGFGNAKKEYLMNVIFGQNTISSAFWYVTLIAFILTMAFTIVSVARSTMDLEGKRPVGKVLGSTGKAMLSFLLVPFIIICTINLSSMVLVKSSEAISLGAGIPETTIGTHLFLTLCSESFKTTDTQAQQRIKNAYYSANDTKHVYTNTKQVETDFDVKTIKYFSGYIVCLALALMMIIASFLFIVRIFEVVILYIVSPFFVASMPLDEGARFKSWRDLFIAKLVSGFGMVYAMKIYILLIPILLGTNVRFFDNIYKNTIMQLVFLVGGSFAVIKSNSLIMQAVNPQAAMAEAAGAGTAMGAAMGVAAGVRGTAVGLGKLAGKMGSKQSGDPGKVHSPVYMVQQAHAAPGRSAPAMPPKPTRPAPRPPGSGPVIGAHRMPSVPTTPPSNPHTNTTPEEMAKISWPKVPTTPPGGTSASSAMPPKPTTPAPKPPASTWKPAEKPKPPGPK